MYTYIHTYTYIYIYICICTHMHTNTLYVYVSALPPTAPLFCRPLVHVVFSRLPPPDCRVQRYDTIGMMNYYCITCDYIILLCIITLLYIMLYLVSYNMLICYDMISYYIVLYIRALSPFSVLLVDSRKHRFICVYMASTTVCILCGAPFY